MLLLTAVLLRALSNVERRRARLVLDDPLVARYKEPSESGIWARTPVSRPEVTPRYTPAITTSVMAKNSSARRLVSERS